MPKLLYLRKSILKVVNNLRKESVLSELLVLHTPAEMNAKINQHIMQWSAVSFENCFTDPKYLLKVQSCRKINKIKSILILIQ